MVTSWRGVYDKDGRAKEENLGRFSPFGTLFPWAE
jgi:hypothetical protein